MKRIGQHIICQTLIAAVFAAAGLRMSAQDLNPTVEVSRQYRGTIVDLNKPTVGMAVPDSLLQFNLDFDYSVFDNPFKGAYEFRPFLMDMELAPALSGERSFYLVTGAGYSLHPVLDMVWTPVRSESFRLSLYASHNSYIGKYRSLGPGLSGSQAVTLEPDGRHFSGHDMVSKAGADGSYDWKTGILSFRTGYFGTAFKDTTVTRGYDGFEIGLGVASKERLETHFVYDVAFGYRYAEDKFTYSGMQKNYLTEHDLDLDARFGGTFRSGHSVMLDLGLDFASYGAAYDSDAGNFSVTPRYLYSGGRWNVDLGVELAFLVRNNRSGSPVLINTAQGQIVYPDIRIDFNLLRNHLDMYLEIGGGPDINRYSSILSSWRHVTPFFNTDGSPLIDNTIERISAAVGFDGNIASRFDYDLRAGYRNFGNALLETLSPAGSILRAGIAYASYQMFFTQLDYSWKSPDFLVGGYFRYQATDISRRNPAMFSLPAFSGSIDFMYNWKERIYAGIDCDFASSRRCAASTALLQPAEVRIPGYADLGVKFGYAFTRKFSLWLRGGNLLDMTIQKSPLYAESGIYFTGGICLNL